MKKKAKLPLSGIIVLDFTHTIQGPYCCRILGDLGADVIHVENPKSSYHLRRWSQGFASCHHYASFNRNKRSIMIDLKKEEGRRIVYELAKTADVVVENFRPGVADRLGIGYETLSSINKKIVYLSASGFGQNGPYRERGAVDFVIQAESGLMDLTGEPPPRPPCKVGIGPVDLASAIYNTIAVLAALQLRKKTGKGNYLDTALYTTMVSLLTYHAGRYFVTDVEPKRQGHIHPMIFAATFKAKDGKYLIIQAPNNRLFRLIGETMGLGNYVENLLSKYKSAPAAWQNCKDEIMNTFKPVFETKTRNEWVEILNEASVPCGPVYNIGEVFRDPQVQHRKMVMEIERPPFGNIPTLRNPIRGTERMWELRIPPALPGEHTDGILRELGRSEEEIARLKTDGVIKSWDIIPWSEVLGTLVMSSAVDITR